MTKITKRKFKEAYWFEDDLVWLPKASREKVKRNTYAIKKQLILRIAKDLQTQKVERGIGTKAHIR